MTTEPRNEIIRAPEDQLPAISGPKAQYYGAEEPEIRDYFSILRRRWKVMLAVAVIVFAAVAGNTLIQRKVYEATTKLVVSTKSPSGGGGDDSGLLGGLLSLRQGRNVDTQVEIINSQDLIDQAYARIPEKDRLRGFLTTTVPLWSYDVKSKQDTDVVLITARSFVPETAAEFSNTIAETYLDLDLNRSSQSTRQARQYVEREMGRSKAQLAGASVELSKFKKSTGLVAASDQVSKLAQAVIDLKSAYVAARSDEVAAAKQVNSLRNQIKQTSPTIQFSKTTSTDAEYLAIRAAIVDLESKLAAANQEFRPGAPEVKQIEDQIADQKGRLKQVSRTEVTSQQSQHNPVLDGLVSGYTTGVASQIAAQAKAEALSNQLNSLDKNLNEFPEQERRLAELQQRVDVLNRTFNMLSDRYYTLLIEERSSLPNGLIAARARAPLTPSSPKVMLNLVLGLILSLGAAVGVGALLERLDMKIHQPEEVERSTGVATLALVPEALPVEGGDGRLRLGSATPGHAFTEAFRLLRNNLMFSSPDAPLKKIAVTSAMKGDGKSTASVNLAIALAMDGKKVLLLDLDLRRPTVHSWIRAKNDVGFTSIVRGAATFDEAIKSTEWGFDAITSGPIPPDPTEFLNSEKSHKIIEEAKERYDIVILDSPPCTGLSDMQVIATIADGVLLVASLDNTPKPLLIAAQRLLRLAGARILGTVVNRAKATTGGYYGRYGYYGYYGYYSYEEDTDDKSKKKKHKQSAPKSLGK